MLHLLKYSCVDSTVITIHNVWGCEQACFFKTVTLDVNGKWLLQNDAAVFASPSDIRAVCYIGHHNNYQCTVNIGTHTLHTAVFSLYLFSLALSDMCLQGISSNLAYTVCPLGLAQSACLFHSSQCNISGSH